MHRTADRRGPIQSGVCCDGRFDLRHEFGWEWRGTADFKVDERTHAFQNRRKGASRLVDHEHEVVKALGRNCDEPSVNCNAIARENLAYKVEVVFEIERAGCALMMILRSQSKSDA